MSIILWGITLLIELSITYVHFFSGLANPLTDLIASIPNLFFALFFIFNLFIISVSKLELKILFYLKCLILIFIYLYAYLLFAKNTIITTNTSHNVILANHNFNNPVICSQNTKHAQAINNPDFYRTLRIYNCNIILLQEVENSALKVYLIKQNLKKFLHKNYSVQTYGEFVTASIFPFKKLYFSSSNGFVVNLFNLKNRKIIIINTHIWTPLKKQTPEFNPNLNFPVPPFFIRKKQTTELTQYLQLITETPTLLIGDFNMLPTHSFLTRNLANFNFYRVKSKKFITPTFSTSIPIIEIDHTFTNNPYLIKSRNTILNQYSDHALQIIKLNFN